MKEHDACKMFPMLEGAAFDAMKADIKANGLKEPIETLDGVLIDGRNRLRACKELGIKPVFEAKTAKEVGDVFAYQMSKNLFRRHLTPQQQGMAQLAYEKHVGFDPKAEKRGRPSKKGKMAHDGPISRRTIAKRFGVSHATYDRNIKAAETYQAASPDMRKAIDEGAITTTIAAAIAKKVEKHAAAMNAPSDPETTAKVRKVFEEDVKDAAEERGVVSWVHSCARASGHYAGIFLRRRWDRSTMAEVRVSLKEIAKNIQSMSRKAKS